MDCDSWHMIVDWETTVLSLWDKNTTASDAADVTEWIAHDSLHNQVIINKYTDRR